MAEDGWSQLATFGGAELGRHVGQKVLDITELEAGVILRELEA
jgi:hypothetical protein